MERPEHRQPHQLPCPLPQSTPQNRLPFHAAVCLNGSGGLSRTRLKPEHAPALIDQCPARLLAQLQVLPLLLLVLEAHTGPPCGLYPAGRRPPFNMLKLRRAEPDLLQLQSLRRQTIELSLGRLGVLRGITEPAPALSFPHLGPSPLSIRSMSAACRRIRSYSFCSVRSPSAVRR